MSSRRQTSPLTRRAILFGGCAALAGCGFAPVYGTGGQAAALRNATVVESEDTVEGYRIRQHLEDRLGIAATARFRLSITVDVTRRAVAVASDNNTTRQRLEGAATYRLINDAGQVVTHGTVSTFTAYSTTGSTVATAAAEEDAQDRLMIALGDLIVTRLIAAAPQ